MEQNGIIASSQLKELLPLQALREKITYNPGALNERSQEKNC
jgi:hypothetical protein